MSGAGAAADATPLLSEESEEETGSASGVSGRRALLTVLILCYVNLLNYMDRFTVAGTWTRPQPLTCLLTL